MGALELTISDKSLQSLSCNFTDVWVFTLPLLNASPTSKAFSDYCVRHLVELESKLENL